MGGLLLRLVICVQVLIGTVAVGARPPATAMYVFPPPVTFPSRGVGAHRTVAAGARSPATAMYVFGSSILDVGNNNYLPGASVARANRRYNGIDFPSSIPTGRFSNGYNIADYVAKSMGFASSPPAYLSLAPSSGPLVQNAVANGISYASGGAGILDSTNAGNTIRLSKQVQYFGTTKAKMVAALGPNVANALLSRSIFLIGIGNNDMYVFESAERAQNRSAVEQRRETAVLYGNLISNYTATMRELYSMGARKFAIVNIGLLGCVPAVRVLSPTGECWDSLNQLAGGFNEALRPWLAGLARRLPGLAYSLADLFAFTRDTLADPQASGYTEVAGACCGGGRLRGEAQCSPNSTLCANRDQHVFWDRAHFSQRTAFLIAQAFCNGPAKYTNPVNFMQLAGSVSEITEALESSR